ncbi:MAG: site-specific integrase [Clostridium sp.]|jgi:site-specific recombinase XerD|nr:site-specific integrase [Clostridium sp.]
MGRVKSGEVKDTLLFGLIHDFFKVYLPKQKNSSEHTITAYKYALDNLLDYVVAQKNIGLSAVTFEMIDRKTLAAYLDDVEADGSIVSTRNHRLACIRAFYAYAAKMESAAVIHHGEILKVPLKKSSEPEAIAHMSEAAASAILAQPDTTTARGLRDQFLLLIFYGTGARIAEVLDIRLRDIKLGATPTVTIQRGKGRGVPLSEKAVAHYNNYLGVFHADEPRCSAQHLFYTILHGRKNPMGSTTVRGLMSRYGASAREICGKVPANVYPHLWRHSRAMHLYQRGMDLTLVSQWLGHANLEATLVYAHADTGHKRKAIEAAVPDGSPLKSFVNPARYKVTDDETLKRLYGLR